jgi:hypothetical protein
MAVKCVVLQVRIGNIWFKLRNKHKFIEGLPREELSVKHKMESSDEN